MKPSPQDLAALCRDLRAAGVPVDVRHELRLREVFERAGPVTGARVRRLVQAVVLADPADRADVDDVLDGWLPGIAHTAAPTGPALAAAPVPGGTPPQKEPPPAPRVPWDTVLGAVLAVVALVGVVLLALPNGPDPALGGGDLAPAQDAGVDQAVDAGEVPTPTGRFPVPTLSVEPGQATDWSPWFIFGIGLLGLVAVGPQARRWRAFPEALPPADGGPPAPPPRPPVSAALASWSDPADRRAMVWGVDHFETDEPSHRLDLRGSIRATARAAFRPVVRYRRRRQPRTVWLWVDALADPQAEEVARQVLGDLRRANLDARLAWTFGSPERVVLDDHDQTELASAALDTPPDGAIVVWFTDGHGLSHVDDEAERRRAVRALRAWPRLAVVRCGGEVGDLRAHVRNAGAAVLTPERVAGWIGRGVTPRKPKVDLTAWQAAAALSPTPVDEATLLALGAQLGYPTPRALLDGVLAEAQMVGPRITWAPRVRAGWLSWLGRQPELAELVSFWLAHHAAPSDDDGRTARARAVDRALLSLWLDPEQASWDLAAHPDQAERVRAALRHLTPADGQPDDPDVTARLPWTWGELSAEARVRLSALGLAGVPSGLRPVRPGRQWFGLGLSAALVALGLSMGVAQWLTAPDLEPREAGERPAGATLTLVETGRWVASLRDGVHAEQTVRAGERLVVHWGGRHLSCAERFGAEGEIWRCLDAPPPAAPDDPRWPQLLLVAISAQPTDPAARRLAHRLLRSGAADLVVLRPWPWRETVKTAKGQGVALLGWTPFMRPDVPLDAQQTVLVDPTGCGPKNTLNVGLPNCITGDFDRLAAAVGPEVRPLSQVWPGRAAASAVLRGKAPSASKVVRRDDSPDVIYFDADESAIRADQRPKIEAAAQRLRDDPSLRLTLNAHVEQGSESMSISISGRLSRAVSKALQAQGVASARITMRDFGTTRPAIAKPTPAQRMLNRRVELEWTEGEGDELKDPVLKVRLANWPKGEVITVLVDGVSVYKGAPTGDRRPDVYEATVPPGEHTATALVRGKVRVSQTVGLDAGDRHVILLDLKAQPAKTEGQRVAGADAPPRTACSPAELRQLREALLPPGAIEINLGAGGPGSRPDVACTLDFQIAADGSVQLQPARGEPSRPDVGTCERLAKEAATRRAPKGLRCSGLLEVRWRMPAADRPDPGAAVRLKGDRLLVEGAIKFHIDKARLTAEGLRTVARLAEFLKAHPELALVEVANHRDSRGRVFGREITKQRAEEVVGALVKDGVARGRLRAVGYGETRPIAPNTTAANRAKNRRTEFTVLKRDDRNGNSAGSR